jgi:sucrose phosphorylase
MNTQDMSPLYTWLEMAPRNCINVLDTHDGIGIVDVGANGDEPGLLTPAQIDALVESIHTQSDGQSRQATGAAASNVDLYQVNCTFYSALGCDDYRYLLARTIQLFAPGTPQIYYAGLLALQNDMALLADTGVGRDINRPYLDESTVIEHLQKPVVQALLQLISLRNEHQAFQGEFTQVLTQMQYSMKWQQHNQSIMLTINLDDLSAHIVTGSDTLVLNEML